MDQRRPEGVEVRDAAVEEQLQAIDRETMKRLKNKGMPREPEHQHKGGEVGLDDEGRAMLRLLESRGYPVEESFTEEDLERFRLTERAAQDPVVVDWFLDQLRQLGGPVPDEPMEQLVEPMEQLMEALNISPLAEVARLNSGLSSTAVYTAPFEGDGGGVAVPSDGTGVGVEVLKQQLAEALGLPEERLQQALDGCIPREVQGDLFEEGLETEPIEGAPDHVHRVRRKMNMPGGVLMDTRNFEKWVLENFVPMQDMLYRLDEQCDQLARENATLKSDLAATKMRLSKLINQVRGE